MQRAPKQEPVSFFPNKAHATEFDSSSIPCSGRKCCVLILHEQVSFQRAKNCHHRTCAVSISLSTKVQRWKSNPFYNILQQNESRNDFHPIDWKRWTFKTFVSLHPIGNADFCQHIMPFQQKANTNWNLNAHFWLSSLVKVKWKLQDELISYHTQLYKHGATDIRVPILQILPQLLCMF